MITTNNNFDFDYLVLGGGSGGVRFARLMGSKGHNVALVEGNDMGGTCVLRGCIPKKLFIYAGSFNRLNKISNEYGWKTKKGDFDLTEFIAKKNQEIMRLSSIYTNLLKNNNVTIIKGWGSFSGANSVKVQDNDGNIKEYTAKKIIIAVGGKSRNINVEGEEHTTDSDSFLNLETIPKEVLIIGGGYIALEFANIMLSLGVKVNIFVRSGKVLNGFDKDIALHLQEELIKQGVNFIKATSINKFEKNSDNTITTNFNTNEKLTTGIVIKTVGRDPNVDNLNLATANIKTREDKAIVVDDYFTTSNPNVYAIGDVINRLTLTPVATKEAMVMVHNFNNPNNLKKMNYNFVASAVFSYPEVAYCGLTEQEAIEAGYTIDIYKSSFRPLKYSLTSSNIKSFMKIIVDNKTQKVLGIHICDTEAGEIMQGFAAALKIGINKQQLDDVVGIHPTSAEEIVTMYNKSN